MKTSRIRWIAATAVALVLVVAAGLWSLRGRAGLGEAASGELLNLEGNPLPDADPVSLRIVVLDAAFGAQGPAWQVDPWDAYLRARALGRAMALVEPDIAVVFDLRLDAPENEIPIHLRTAVEANLPWWGTVTTVDRRTPGWARLLGMPEVAPLRAGIVVLARGPVSVTEASVPRGGGGPQRGGRVASAPRASMRLELSLGPNTRIALQADDVPPSTQTPGSDAVLSVSRGGTGRYTSDDGALAVTPGAGWNVTQFLPAMTWENAAASGVLLDLSRSR